METIQLPKLLSRRGRPLPLVPVAAVVLGVQQAMVKEMAAMPTSTVVATTTLILSRL